MIPFLEIIIQQKEAFMEKSKVFFTKLRNTLLTYIINYYIFVKIFF